MNLQKENLKYFEEYQNLLKENRTSEAIFLLEQKAQMILNILGIAYSSETKNQEKAQTCFETVLKIDPTNINACSNLAHINNVTENFEKGLAFAHRSIIYSNGTSYEAYYNQGVILLAMGRTQDAKKAFEESLKLDPKSHNSNYNFGLALLKTGICQQGWDQYEWRFKSNKMCEIFGRRCQKMWNGEDIKDKTLFIFNEQGYGDFFFFLRFIPEIRKLGCKIICEIQEVLLPIAKKIFSEEEILIRPDIGILPPLPKSDYQVSICSLAKIFKIDEESKIPPNIRIEGIRKNNLSCPSENQLKVGICWFGNMNHVKDHLRSTYIRNFKPILDIPGVTFFGLGKNKNMTRNWSCGHVNLNCDIEKLNIIDLDSQTENFGDLANQIDQMDLVITVDTVVAHLAGVLGKKTFLILGLESDFRWQEERQDTPWYPSIQIFRFDKTWEKTILNVKEEFLKFFHGEI